MSENTDSRTAVVVKTQSEWQAELLAGVLRDNGIDAQIAGFLTAQFRAEAPGLVRVIVPDTQLEDAERVLSEHRATSSEIDWSKIDVGSPEDDSD